MTTCAQLFRVTGYMLDGAEHADSIEEIDEYARRLSVLRAVRVAADTSVIPEEHLADIVRLGQEERDWHVEDLARQRDHLQIFIIRNDPDLGYHDDAGRRSPSTSTRSKATRRG